MKNKNILKALLISGLVLGATSCSDFLDQQSPSEHTPDAVSTSPYYTGLVLNKAYGELTEEGIYGQLMAITLGTNSDIELIDGQDASTTSQTNSERGACNFNMVAGSWSKIQTTWDKLYEGIEYSNNVIELVNNFDTQSGNETKSNIKLMHRYRAEAITVRALLYFNLVRNFGDVPMKLEGTKSDLTNIYVGKTDRDEIMDSMIVELERAIPDLCWAGENSYTTERITKGYAHGLLAQIALQRAGWAIRESQKDGYETATENSDPTYPTQRPGAAERSAGAYAGDEEVYFAVEVFPDFRAGRLVVGFGVYGVGELAGDEAVRRLFSQFFSFGDSAGHALAAFSQDEFCAVCFHDLAAFDAHRFRHGDDDAISLGCGYSAQADAGVAAGRFDDHRFRIQDAFCFSVFDHRFSDSVFYAAGRVEVFQFSEQICLEAVGLGKFADLY